MQADSAPIITVAGATGNIGSACAKFLLSSGACVRCLVREEQPKTMQLKELGATITVGNYNDAASLQTALDGASAAFLVCSNQDEQVALESAFITAAEASGSVKYLVKISTCGVYVSPDSPIEYGRIHAACEAFLASTASRMQWTVLRPNCFFQNHVGDIFGTLPHKLLAYPRTPAQLVSGCARTVDTRDVGEIAARLLLLDDPSAHHAHAYDVCGPDSWSVQGLATAYEAALSLEAGAITCLPDVSEEGYASNLESKAGFPGWLARAVACSQVRFWADGKLDYPSSPALLALHPTFRTMREWMGEHVGLVKLGGWGGGDGGGEGGGP